MHDLLLRLVHLCAYQIVLLCRYDAAKESLSSAAVRMDFSRPSCANRVTANKVLNMHVLNIVDMSEGFNYPSFR